MLALMALALAVFAVPAAWAFPPYRSTDADTAEPGALETRLGLVEYTREQAHDSVDSPQLRVNLGLPSHTEVNSEASYSQDTGEIDEAALGFKWIPFGGNPSFGFETVALLPRAGETRTGVEGSLLMTARGDPGRVHVNVGGFDDPRAEQRESGWSASLLAEADTGGVTPGAELFVERPDGEDAQVTAGLGVIVPIGDFDVRAGARFGLTRAAPDFVGSLWVSRTFALWND